MMADLTAVILAHNEAANLPACLAGVAGWAARTIVVDSGSTDGTPAIATRAGAEVVSHPYANAPAQWNWALATLPIATAWILGLDADQRVTPALRDQILAALPAAPPGVAGYYVQRRLIFRGQWLRWGGCTRPMLKLFRTGRARCDEREAPDHRFLVDGTTGRLRGALLEDNRNEDAWLAWIAKQRRYAGMLAASERRWRLDPSRWTVTPHPLGTPDQRVLWRKQLWFRLPRYVRPPVYFFYRYVLLGGFLDGWRGLQYHAGQGFWLRWHVDLALGRLGRPGAAT